jgi:hypothetical protein
MQNNSFDFQAHNALTTWQVFRNIWICSYMNTLMFKKRPNFLNSSPTSTEDALRLLSTLSGRFWQQTAIFPVSLWALVVELHPLNWARARAQFSGCSSTTNAHSETGQMAVCCQNLPLGALSSLSASSSWLTSYLESSVFFWTRGDSGKCDKRTARHHRKCVPESIPKMEETLGTVYPQWRGLLWRGQCLKCCKIKFL